MKHLFKPETLRTLLVILFVLAGAKVLWVIVASFWLPTSGVEQQEEHSVKNLYYRVDIVPKEGKPARQAVPKVVQGSIKDIKLLAVYSASDIAVITVEHKKKSKVLSTGDEINGFVLESAGSTFAYFSKGGKSYRVDLVKPKKSSSGRGSITPSSSSIKTDTEKSSAEGEITDAGDHKIVDRSLITHYTTNMDAIFKDIGISDVKKDGKVEGFKIGFVRRGSHFSKLGLRRGDVIKSVNGQEMNSYNAAMGIYKNIGTLQTLTLVIKRGDQEMELEYEIN